jgi:Ser/Thr protein kinase RdoA (MazF antagonist)
MKPYSMLTLHGQAQRLRQLAMNALTHYDLDVARLRLLTNDMNGIFRIDTADGRKFVLRVTLPEGGHTLEHVTAEMDWLAALARDTQLSVPQPLPARDGSLVVEASAQGVPEARLCVVFSWVKGNDLADDLSADNLVRLGELMAQLHIHALNYHPPNQQALLHFDRVFPFPEPVLFFEEKYSLLFPPERRAVFEEAIAWVQDSIDRLQASGEPARILHGDLHQWNVRNRRGVLSPIDFEDLMLGWPVEDIATTLYYLPQESSPAWRAAFEAGYCRHSLWPERQAGEIDSFIAARALGLANFLLNDPNPAWKSKAADFLERVEGRLRELLKQRTQGSHAR